MVAGFTSEGTFVPSDGMVLSPTTSHSITLLSGQNCVRGTVLGAKSVTDGLIYLKSLSGASDGSQTAVAILAEDCDATSGNKVTVAYFAGTFDQNTLTYGTAHTALTTRESLRDVGINLQPSIVR